jgi:hypothetical protein
MTALAFIAPTVGTDALQLHRSQFGRNELTKHVPQMPARARFSSWTMADDNAPKRVAVVGAGWAGLGAAYALAQQKNIEVTLIDAAPSVGGLVAGWKTKKGKSVEAGVHGFWNNRYPNVQSLIEKDLGLRNALTPWTRSAQRSPKGKGIRDEIIHRCSKYIFSPIHSDTIYICLH